MVNMLGFRPGLVSRQTRDSQTFGPTAIRRSGIQGPQPAPTTRLVSGDGVVVFGSPEAIEKAEKRILEG